MGSGCQGDERRLCRGLMGNKDDCDNGNKGCPINLEVEKMSHVGGDSAAGDNSMGEADQEKTASLSLEPEMPPPSLDSVISTTSSTTSYASNPISSAC